MSATFKLYGYPNTNEGKEKCSDEHPISKDILDKYDAEIVFGEQFGILQICLARYICAVKENVFYVRAENGILLGTNFNFEVNFNSITKEVSKYDCSQINGNFEVVDRDPHLYNILWTNLGYKKEYTHNIAFGIGTINIPGNLVR